MEEQAKDNEHTTVEEYATSADESEVVADGDNNQAEPSTRGLETSTSGGDRVVAADVRTAYGLSTLMRKRVTLASHVKSESERSTSHYEEMMLP